LGPIPWRALAEGAPELDGPLAEILGGAAAERVLDRFLRARRELSRDARAACAEALFGVGLWRRRLAWHLGDDGGDPSRFAPRALLGALVRDLAGVADAEAITGASLPPPRAAPDALELRWSLPGWLGDELRRAAGDDAAALAEALSTPGPVFLRANLARTTLDGLAARLAAEGIAARRCAHAPAGLEVVTPRPNLLASPAFRAGLLEVQDEGSQLAGALASAPGGEVLDACAGRGGKALQLAALGSRVVACDPDPARLARLRDRAARAGAAVEVSAEIPTGRRFDVVIADVPCSELGPLRRGPDLRFRLDPATFAALPALQVSILRGAASAVREGGRLVYVTCTFRREEDEEVVGAFEREHPAFERVPADAPAAFVGEDGLFRALPHRHGTDGFFGAVWRRLR
jgi:16S rRNA (cytosine967-C5)-methyltransferase